jgi:hypothetical protein
MSNNDDICIRDIIKNLLDAENNGKSEIAKPYLSEDFIAITRSKGLEQNKEELIKAIDESTKDKKKIESDNKQEKRRLERDHFKVFYWNNVAVSRSIVNFQNEKFRNIHVFVNEKGNWLCKMWQVTKLESLDKIRD